MLKTNRELYQIKSEEDSCLNLQNLRNDTLLVQHKCGLMKIYKKRETQWTAYKSINIYCHFCRYICIHKILNVIFYGKLVTFT